MIYQVRESSSGKFQPIEYRNLAHPGQCISCNRIGRTPDELFANFQVELEYYGLVYLCLDCCAEAAKFIKFESPERVFDLEAELVAAKAVNISLERKVEYLKGLLDARIDSAGSSKSDSNDSDGVAIFETEPDTDFIDSIINPNEPIVT